MRKRVYNLGGKIFEEYKTLYCPNITTRRTLWEVYKKPSAKKVAIYNDWRNWFACNSESIKDFMTIGAYNAQYFTLSGVVTINSQHYLIRITPTRNLFAKVSHEYCREVLGWTN